MHRSIISWYFQNFSPVVHSLFKKLFTCTSVLVDTLFYYRLVCNHTGKDSVLRKFHSISSSGITKWQTFHVRESKRLGHYAGRQEVSRCRTRNESEGSVTYRCNIVSGYDLVSHTLNTCQLSLICSRFWLTWSRLNTSLVVCRFILVVVI